MCVCTIWIHMTYVKSMSFSQAARKHWPMVKFQNFTSPSCDRHWPPINLWHQFHLTKSAVLKCWVCHFFCLKRGCHDVTFLPIFPPLRRLRRLEHYGLTSPLPGTSHSLPQRLCRESVSPSSGSNLGMLGKYSEILRGIRMDSQVTMDFNTQILGWFGGTPSL